jgi:ABC-type multidrug transport system permease subunit
LVCPDIFLWTTLTIQLLDYWLGSGETRKRCAVLTISYWKIGNSYADLQTRMFAVFNFVFVAPGVMVQTQPKFIANRDVFEKREKKAKTYSWVVFCIAEIVAELPYLVVCAALFWCCWYVTMFSSL